MNNGEPIQDISELINFIKENPNANVSIQPESNNVGYTGNDKDSYRDLTMNISVDQTEYRIIEEALNHD